ncbi:hypothetical protein H9P43_001399 [Blastocladiella emersonii ATCC 22665]|nr:hypothetical protein H9P43_001399 [Blastocladiella emersonii ATCC 22665]
MPKLFESAKGSFAKLNGSKNSVGPRSTSGNSLNKLDPKTKSRSNNALESLRSEVPPVEYSMRARAAARLLQILFAIIQISVLARLDSNFLQARGLATTYAVAIWFAYLTILFAVAMFGMHYHPDINKGKLPLSRVLGAEFAVSLLVTLFHSGSMIAQAANSATGGSLKVPCSPGTENGRCDMLNLSVLFTTCQVLAWGYMAFRSARDLFWKGHGDNQYVTMSDLVRFNRSVGR